MHISLTPELEEIIRKKVDSGLYNNASEVVREAIRFIHFNQEVVNDIKKLILQNALIEGEKSGVARYSLESMLKELDNEI